MKIRVNGNDREVRKGATLAELLAELKSPGKSTAVAVNLVVVPRGELARRVLTEGDSVEIIEAVGGG
jgi:thiamine biosynthesis protein ThiS